MVIFDAGNVRANKTSPLFNVALGEFLFLTKFAEPITNYHRGIISLRRLEGKQTNLLVALAFRNGPIEDVHAGKPCPTCSQDASYSRISDAEMKLIMKNAVDQVYSLLWMKQNKPIEYAASLELGRPLRNYVGRSSFEVVLSRL